jgi:ABC-2 type transport system ATP-binding protein
MSAPAFEVQGVARSFSTRGRVVAALSKITLAGYPGERLALTGSNGSGKSTLLRLLAGLLLPEAGTVRVADGDPARTARVRTSLGLCTGDERSLFLRLSARENLRFFAALYGAAAAERIDEVAEVLGFRSSLDVSANALSSGLRARLLLARAVLHRPRLLLIDESTHALDAEGRALLRSLLLRTTADGSCVVFVSHDPTEVAALATRRVTLREGAVAEDSGASLVDRETHA